MKDKIIKIIMWLFVLIMIIVIFLFSNMSSGSSNSKSKEIIKGAGRGGAVCRVLQSHCITVSAVCQ